MTFRSMRGAFVLAVLFAGACQTYQAVAPSTTPMDGVWSSTDGVFVATFNRGSFTSRFTTTNEILAQGTYGVAGSTINMRWISVATQQGRSATCTFIAADSVTCNQEGGGHFQLARSPGTQGPTGIPPTMAPPAQG